MNNSFVQRQAKHFAERVLHEAAGDVPRAVDAAYSAAFGRGTDGRESANGRWRTPARMAWKILCWVLLNSTEFMYVE